MEVADIFELRQCQELLPIESYRVFNLSVDFEFPFFEWDFGTNAEVQHGKVMNLPLARWQAVFRPDAGAFLASHFSGPFFFRGYVGVFHFDFQVNIPGGCGVHKAFCRTSWRD